MRFKLTLAIIASFVAAPAVADDRRLPEQATPARGVYVGVFGGGGFSTSTNATRLCTNKRSVRGLFVQDGFLHKNSQRAYAK